MNHTYYKDHFWIILTVCLSLIVCSIIGIAYVNRQEVTASELTGCQIVAGGSGMECN